MKRSALPANPFASALLPWENQSDLEALRRAWHEDLAPAGAAQTSLVDQLVWLDWRRRRLIAGERGTHMASLEERVREDRKARETLSRALVCLNERADLEELRAAVSSCASDDAQEAADVDKDSAMTQRAIAILETGDPAAYDEALAALREDTARWWEDVVSNDEQTHPDGQPAEGEDYQPHSRTASSLLRFLKEDVMKVLETSQTWARRRPAIRLQAQAESLDAFRFERILALDERLTRQVQRTLAMLGHMQARHLRSAKPANP